MRIEKIELIGFKSFADKTTFTLHQGITGIVGPNGCGKSNIVDAFRWVLGEQSAKSLRGDKMEEVIFNGSTTKKPKGMAEVSLVISGLNGASGNGNSHEDTVTVSRRLYRSGESEYMINKNTCRLKDIRDIFLDTGLDFRSYSILEQGRIGEIVNSKPQDRRFIIEEVAGVMKYKIRKAEALSKLESSRANLLRITDIISEVKKQINILDRLARKAERYKKLSSEMRGIELKITRREFQSIKESHAAILEEYGGLKEKEAIMSGEISDAENRTEARRLAVIEREKALEIVQKEFQGVERDISEFERSIAVGKNEIVNLAEYQSKLLGQEEEIAAGKMELSSRIDELTESSRKLVEEMENHADVLLEKVGSFKEAEDDLAQQEDLLEEKRREVFRISEQLSNIKNESGRHHTSYEALERREAASQRESDDARKVLGEIESSITSIESEIHGSNNEILFLEEKKQVLVRELAASKAKLEELINALSLKREEMASSSSRLDSLKEIVFDTPTRDLISSMENVKLVGSLSEVLEVSAEYEKAIESALSERADLIIMETAHDIVSAISSLKEKEIGKTAFASISTPRKTTGSVEAPSGIIGNALQFVKIKEGYESIVENLLSDVLLVNDIENAFELKVADGKFTYVTRDGEVLEPSGAVIVGAGKGIFRRRREIRELEDLIETSRTEIEKISSETGAVQAVIAEKEESIKGVDISLHKLEKDISLSRLTVDNYTEEKERLNRKISYLALELEGILKEKESLKTSIAACEERLRGLEGEKTGAEAETISIQEEISRKKSEMEGHRSEVTELKLLAASKRERVEAMRNEQESAVKAVEALEQKKAGLAAENESVLKRIEARKLEIAGLEENLRGLVSRADTLRAQISVKKEEIDGENESLIEVEHGLKTMRQEASSMRDRISELDVQKAEHKMKLENLEDNVRTNYGTEIAEIELLDVTTEEEERLVELRNKIQEMGAVNLGTLDEYEELRTRYEFMSKQHDDLTQSIAELEEAISKINGTTRKRLREAFETLNTKFGEIYKTLFGGGRAELVLTEENNILESGIDIVVQPPGKKLQNIHLLSGGEKALTALSIQFASFLIKPTPMCILDEADAPLDESNTERYSKMLDELSAETQFIVVTHNRTTMSVAQNLYGITMEEAGVSKVISMQLSDV